MRLLQLQFGRVLAGDDALMRIDEGGEAVEKRRLAEPVPPEIKTFAAHAADDLQKRGALGGVIARSARAGRA